jgi:hypothetical protein
MGRFLEARVRLKDDPDPMLTFRRIAVAWRHESRYPALWRFSLDMIPTRAAYLDCRRALRDASGFRRCRDVRNARAEMRLLIRRIGIDLSNDLSPK